MDQLGLKREIGRHLWESFWKLPDPLFPGLSILNLIGVEFYTRKEKKNLSVCSLSILLLVS